jgi:hypothetical protein
MCDLCRQIFGLVVDLFRSRAALEAEVLVLKQQIIVLRRGKPGRLSFLTVDKIILGWACRLLPSAHVALTIVKPDTVIRWHRAGFRLFWRWKSSSRLGRPAVPTETRQLIREMNLANPLWGAPAHPRRTTQTRDRCRANQRGQVYDAQENSTVAGLEDVLAQPHKWDRGDGPVCRSDHLVPAALWTADHGPRPATNPLARRYRTPNGGMDSQPTDGGLWLGATPLLSDPRSGCLLRRHIRPTRSLAWHSRSSDVSTFTLAERICGAFDRLDPPGMPRPYCCDRRATPAPHPHVLRGVLQRRPNASLIRQGCARSKAHSTHRAHPSEARSWRVAPSIRTDLICGRDRSRVAVSIGISSMLMRSIPLCCNVGAKSRSKTSSRKSKEPPGIVCKHCSGADLRPD